MKKECDISSEKSKCREQETKFLTRQNDVGEDGEGNDIISTTEDRKHDEVEHHRGTGICRHLRDQVYRDKCMQTAWLNWSFVILGWIFGQTGPSFLDLISITGTDIESGSAFMTSGFVGFLIGALLSGFLFDRYNPNLLLFIVIFCCSLVVAVIPWCFRYELMIVAQAFVGLFRGALDAMGNAQLLVVWGSENGPYMQALHFAFGIGGIISPLLTAPFLLPKANENRTMNMHYDNITAMENNFYNHTSFNGSFLNNSIYLRFHSNYSLAGFNSSTENFVEKPKSRLYIAYFITSSLGLSSALPFLVSYIKSRKSKRTRRHTSEDNIQTRKISKVSKILALANMMAILGVFGVIEGIVVQYLSAFCVTYLNWNKSESSTLTSIYWIAFALARFAGIFLIKFVNYVKILTSFCVFLMLDIIALLFSSLNVFTIGIWIFAPLTGVGLSIMFPVVFTWTEAELFPVTGKISSLFLIGASSLRILNPLILGYLMEEMSPMYFCYLLLGYSIVLILLCVSAIFLTRKINKKFKGHSYKDTEIVISLDSDTFKKHKSNETMN